MSATFKLVVMSDLHLVPEGEVANGLDTADRLSRAVESVNANHADADACLLLGDLADRGERAAYERLRGITSRLTVPLLVTLGNHDDRPTFLDVFGRTHAAETGCVDLVLDVKGTRLIVLDSSEPGVVAGVLSAAQLTWLEARLAEARDRPVIVALHHHANLLSLPVDRIRLEQADAFVAILKTHRDVRQVIAGHVHLVTTGVWRGLPFTTIAGGHYSVTPHIPGTPGDQGRLEGPGQYGVVISDAEATLVHFHDFLDRHLVLADGLFRPRAAAARRATRGQGWCGERGLRRNVSRDLPPRRLAGVKQWRSKLHRSVSGA